ncbi:hypothetical protein SAMN03097699_3060 [Flavobacteriaceae bacterium MAR_2010_188]|nr:hypothetical protein SAMN03097699_3060 [Flavobacteriaceae bacterium MAR_2010_188]
MKVSTFTLFSLLLLLFSCDGFSKKKVSTEEILNDELKTFNWNEVDEYPTFDSCNSAEGKENKRQCFEITLRNILNNYLSQQTIIVNEDVNDQIQLAIEIDKNGNLQIEDIKMKSETLHQIPKLDSLLRHGFDSIPKIYPAIKRSQQVTTRFQLPIEIKID